jgi:hypothetical protein
MSDPDKRVDEAKSLYGWMGLALSQWQDVENIHYLLFFKLLDAPTPEICSVIYFGIPTFESRRVMVDRVANCCLSKELKTEWTKLDKRLVAGASARGQLPTFECPMKSSLKAKTHTKLGLAQFGWCPPNTIVWLLARRRHC